MTIATAIEIIACASPILGVALMAHFDPAHLAESYRKAHR